MFPQGPSVLGTRHLKKKDDIKKSKIATIAEVEIGRVMKIRKLPWDISRLCRNDLSKIGAKTKAKTKGANS